MKRTQPIIKLSIPQPCHEDWQNMTPNERGKYCASCNKTVIDFSLYSDRELVDFFKNASGSVCGKLNNWQVNRSIVVSDTRRSSFYRWFLGTALASWLGLAGTASAQNNGSAKTFYQKDSLRFKNNQKQDTLNARKYIQVLLTDSNRMPIAFANIALYSNDTTLLVSQITDVDGWAKIMVPKEYENKKLTLTCLAEGYKKLTDTLTLQSSNDTIIYLAVNMSLGIVSNNTRDTTNIVKRVNYMMIGMVVPAITTHTYTPDNNESILENRREIPQYNPSQKPKQ